jgi:butyryl-CoA dehydrogenase
MKEKGFFKTHYPEQYGGYGMDYKTSFNVLREIAKGSAGVSLLYVVHFMATDVLLKYGTEAQKEKYLKDLVEGNKIAAYSISEPTAGSDAAGIKTVAEKVDKGWKLNGSKYFVTNGSVADLYFVACKTSLDKGARGISLFIIEKETEGVDVTYYADKMGFRSSATTNLVLKDCIVPDENLLGEVDKGFKIALDGLVGGRLGMAAIGVGIGEAALEEAIKFANKREAFGKTIANLYSIQEKIAHMYIKLEASRELLRKACEVRNEGMDYSMEASVAKVFAAKSVNEICYEAIQIMGGHGYIKNNRVERYYRDGRLIDIGVGTSEVVGMVIGSTLLNKK